MKGTDYLLYALGADTNEALAEKIQRSSFLLPLWREWKSIITEPIASYIYPIGTHKTTLVVGAKDSSAFQEMHYYKENLLELVNVFLKQDFFTDIRVQYANNIESLAQSCIDIYAIQEEAIAENTIQRRTESTHTHTPQEDIPETSPIAKAYKAYIEATKG